MKTWLKYLAINRNRGHLGVLTRLSLCPVQPYWTAGHGHHKIISPERLSGYKQTITPQVSSVVKNPHPVSGYSLNVTPRGTKCFSLDCLHSWQNSYNASSWGAEALPRGEATGGNRGIQYFVTALLLNETGHVGYKASISCLRVGVSLTYWCSESQGAMTLNTIPGWA